MVVGQLELLMYTNMVRLVKDMDTAKRTVTQAVSKINAVLGTIGIGLSVAGLVNLGRESINVMGKLQDLHEVTNVAVEDLAGLGIAAKQSGGDFDSVATSITRLAANIGKSPEKFRELGISARDPLEAFKQLSDVFSRIDDPQTRAAIGAATLGRAWQGAAPLLMEGSARIQEMIDAGKQAAGVTALAAQQADEFDKKLVLLIGSGGLVNRVMSPLLPLFNVLADNMLRARQESERLGDTFSPLANIVKGSLAYFGGAAEIFRQITITLGGLGAMVFEIGSHGLFSKEGRDAVKDVAAEMALALEKSQKDFDDWKEHILAAGNAATDTAAATAQLTAEEKRAAEAARVLATAKAQQFLYGQDEALMMAQQAKTLQTLNRAFDSQNQLKLHGMEISSASAKALSAEIDKIAQAADVARQAALSDYNANKRADRVGAAAKYHGTLAKITEETTRQIGAVKSLAAEQDRLNSTWQYGAKTALRNYLDEVENVARQMDRLVTNAFKNMEDALVQFVQTGKLDFTSLANSIIADMIRIAVQRDVTGPLAGYLFGMLAGSSAGYGGEDLTATGQTPGGYQGILSFAGGGYTGDGARTGGVDGQGGFYAVLHPQETVSDGARGGGLQITYAPVFNIDERSDRTQLLQDMQRIARQSNADLVDRLGRAGAL